MDDGGPAAKEVVTASLRTEGRDAGECTRGCAEFVKEGVAVSDARTEGRDAGEST